MTYISINFPAISLWLDGQHRYFMTLANRLEIEYEEVYLAVLVYQLPYHRQTSTWTREWVRLALRLAEEQWKNENKRPPGAFWSPK